MVFTIDIELLMISNRQHISTLIPNDEIYEYQTISDKLEIQPGTRTRSIWPLPIT